MKHRMYGVLFGALLWAVLLPAQAFNLVVHSENPQIPDTELRSTVLAAGAGSNIPDDANVKVYVFSKIIPTPTNDGQYVYFHRIELRRAFASVKPYPYRGWLPIESVERYGLWGPDQSRTQFQQAVHDFFAKVSAVDPNQPVP
jgi:hypothetical protein